MAYPLDLTVASSCRMASWEVIVLAVRRGMPVRSNSAIDSPSALSASSTLPTAVLWGSTRLPTSANIRNLRGEGTWAT
ncbi:hypothetical protein GCM10020219_023000 [Nonomuraea dietziae]